MEVLNDSQGSGAIASIFEAEAKANSGGAWVGWSL